ncbi:MAG: 3-hydroxyacyl-CoA dehydrogenase family protein [Planctomycetota bacterium]
MQIRSVGVVGCGLMGSGITQTCAQKGYPTVVREIAPEPLEKGLERIRAFLAEGVRRGKLTPEERDQTLGRIRGTTDLAELRDCDLVIEAVVENLDEKRRVFAELDRLAKPQAIFASNTSSIPIHRIAAATGRADRFLGLHFMNPVPLMKLVEIVRPDAVREEVYQVAKAFVESLGKVAVTARDTAGFIVNLLLVPYLGEAVRAVERGLATPRDIDTAMKLGCGMPMGPLELLDFVGLDTTLAILDVLRREFNDPRYEAPDLLRRMVAEGKVGKKAGRGFYEYPKP